MGFSGPIQFGEHRLLPAEKPSVAESRRAALYVCSQAVGENHAAEVADAAELLDALGLTGRAIRLAPRTQGTTGTLRLGHGTASGVSDHRDRRERLCPACQRYEDVQARKAASRDAAEMVAMAATPATAQRRTDCGGKKGCVQHHRNGEPLCELCQAWSDRRHQLTRTPPGSRCGSRAGAQMHRDLGEPVCERCRLAESADNRRRQVDRASGRPATQGGAGDA